MSASGIFQIDQAAPYPMTQGYVVGNPVQPAPVILMQNPMVPPMTGIGFSPTNGLMLGAPFVGSSSPVSGVHFGQLQTTTLLRGSRPAHPPEPILPKKLPPLDSYELAGTSKMPNIIVSPTNLEVIHHHRFTIPVPAPTERVTEHLDSASTSDEQTNSGDRDVESSESAEPSISVTSDESHSSKAKMENNAVPVHTVAAAPKPLVTRDYRLEETTDDDLSSFASVQRVLDSSELRQKHVQSEMSDSTTA